jgi:hypothetical protein
MENRNERGFIRQDTAVICLGHSIVVYGVDGVLLSRQGLIMAMNEWTTTPPTEPGVCWGERPDGTVRLFAIEFVAMTNDSGGWFVKSIDKLPPLQGWLHSSMFADYRWQKIVMPVPPSRPKPLSADAMEERAAIVSHMYDYAIGVGKCGHTVLVNTIETLATRYERGEHRK